MNTCRLHPCSRLLLVMCVAVSCVSPCSAVEWDGGGPTDDWLDPLNWQFNMVPGTTDTATIINDTATITGAFVPPVQFLEVATPNIAGGLTMTGGLSSATLEVLSTATISKPGTLQVGPGNAHLLANEVFNQGEITLNANGQVTAFQQYVQNSAAASTVLNSGQITAPDVNFLAGELRGFGQIVGDVVIGESQGPTTASVSPGANLGTLNIMGDLLLHSNAELNIDINTSPLSIRTDRVIVSETATLGGTLNINLSGSGQIDLSDQISILSADNITPEEFFDTINVITSGNEVVVVTFVPTGNFGSSPGFNLHTSQSAGDMFNDGVVDEKDARLFAWAIRDINTYNEEFILSGFSAPCASQSGYCGAAPETLADFDGDLTLTFADIPGFLEKVTDPVAAWKEIVAVFNEVEVPEPSTLWLAATVFVFTGLGRKRQ